MARSPPPGASLTPLNRKSRWNSNPWACSTHAAGRIYYGAPRCHGAVHVQACPRLFSSCRPAASTADASLRYLHAAAWPPPASTRNLARAARKLRSWVWGTAPANPPFAESVAGTGKPIAYFKPYALAFRESGGGATPSPATSFALRTTRSMPTNPDGMCRARRKLGAMPANLPAGWAHAHSSDLRSSWTRFTTRPLRFRRCPLIPVAVVEGERNCRRSVLKPATASGDGTGLSNGVAAISCVR